LPRPEAMMCASGRDVNCPVEHGCISCYVMPRYSSFNPFFLSHCISDEGSFVTWIYG
jgi:hypothetical protein